MSGSAVTPNVNSQTVPMFAPDGTLGDIPVAQINAARAAGAKPAVQMKSPDGDVGWIPADKLKEATAAGGKLIPIANQETQHPGFWHSVLEDVNGAVQGAGTVVEAGLGNPGAQMKLAQGLADQVTNAPKEYAERKAAGYSLPYRVTAPVAEAAGVNVPGMEEAAREGDVAGVAGHTVVPAAAAVAPLLAGEAAEAANAGAKATARGVKKIASAAEGALDPDIVGIVSPRAANLLRTAQKAGKIVAKMREKPGVYPGAPLPETPAPELLQARTLAAGGKAAPPDPSEVLRTIPVQKQPPAVYPGAPLPETPAPAIPSAPLPPSERTLSGDSALRKVLTGQDNANLLKIAKSRGISVTRETQLKPGVADNMLINKIVNDFSPDELEEISARYLESNRFRHDFGDIGPEAWKTMSLQTYFPELKLPQTTIARTHAAILRAAANQIEKSAPVVADSGEDLTSVLQESVKQAKKKPLKPTLDSLR